MHIRWSTCRRTVLANLTALLGTLLGLGACTASADGPAGDRVASAGAQASSAAADSLRLPRPVAVKRVAVRVPSESEVRDTVVLASVRRGRALLNDTRDSLPQHVGNALVCTNCHQRDGTLKNGVG